MLTLNLRFQRRAISCWIISDYSLKLSTERDRCPKRKKPLRHFAAAHWRIWRRRSRWNLSFASGEAKCHPVVRSQILETSSSAAEAHHFARSYSIGRGQIDGACFPVGSRTRDKHATFWKTSSTSKVSIATISKPLPKVFLQKSVVAACRWKDCISLLISPDLGDLRFLYTVVIFYERVISRDPLWWTICTNGTHQRYTIHAYVNTRKGLYGSLPVSGRRLTT